MLQNIAPFLRSALVLLMALNAWSVSAQRYRVCVDQSRASRQQSEARTYDIDNEVLVIPVVFHIVYGSSEQNISDEQIMSQLEVINEDFSATNADAADVIQEFRAVTGNPRLKFTLADDHGVRGITRTQTLHGPFFNDDLHSTTKGGKDAWDTNLFLNVWIADLGNQFFGYGTPPGTPPFRDGAAIHFEYVGRGGSAASPFDLGRTLTHELGHWMGLQHVWGDGGCNSSDNIDDTPVQDNPVNGCDLERVSCGTKSMTQNFMNSSDDHCMNLFTIQQSIAMRETLMSSRPQVYSRDQLMTGIAEQKEFINSIYPNPLKDQQFITIELNNVISSPAELSITDISGNIIKTKALGPGIYQYEVGMSGVASGMYLVFVKSRGRTYKNKIIVNRNL